MKHLGLFEGIGGFSLAARWMGWETIAWCEWNEFAQEVLKYHFPKAEGYGDITKVNFKKYNGSIDIITGGFPCQPYSFAGSRKGKEDNRHLWPEMLRAIREVKPKWVVGENVPGIVDWAKGLVFEEIQSDLEAEGYKTLPLLLPAISVGADHIRERIWFVAYSGSMGWNNAYGNNGPGSIPINDTKRRGPESQGWDKKTDELDSSRNTFLQFEEMYGQSAVLTLDDGFPFELDGIAVSEWVKQSLKAAGNAIVPQVALQIFKTIDQFNQ